MKKKHSELKQEAIDNFHDHVSSGKADFWKMLDMELVIGKREGPYVWDMDGEKRFNLHTNGGTYNLGHRNPAIIKALSESLESLDIGNGHLISKARADLGRKISDLMPGNLNYTVFGVSGGEAVDLALKVARSFTGRPGIISAMGGYHGHTGLALAAGDEKYMAPFGPRLPGFSQVTFNDIQAIDKAVDDNTAAVILETVPATLGMPVPDKEYLQKLRSICDDRGALLIMDEVQTGLGRTGKLWAFEHFDIQPDMVVLGKGLSGGVYPITATVLRQPLESIFHEGPHIHVSTFGGAELGCMVAMKVLEISSAPEFLEHVNLLAEKFAVGVELLSQKHEALVKLRQLGLFMGLEMKDDLAGQMMAYHGYQNGLFMVYANNCKKVCQFLPPLTTTMEQVDEVLNKLDEALGQFS